MENDKSQLKIKYLDDVMGIEGQISRAEADALIDLAGSVRAESAIVEIGSFRGRSSVAMAYGSLMGNKNRVYAIDPHVEFTGVLGGMFGPEDQAELYRNVVRAGVEKIVAVVSLPSVSAAKGWHDKNIGLLWIDGDHRYDAVRADFEAWEPFVMDDGVIAFHDCNLEGVKKLIDELILAKRISPVKTVELISCFSKGKGGF